MKFLNVNALLRGTTIEIEKWDYRFGFRGRGVEEESHSIVWLENSERERKGGGRHSSSGPFTFILERGAVE